MLRLSNKRRGDSEFPLIFFLVAAFIICMVCFVGCYTGSHVEVSDGYRDSTVRKLSETGLMWKTWEVETLGDGLRSADNKINPETFTYTVKDHKVVEQLKTAPTEQKVRIHYKKYLTLWTPKGESRYFITSVELLHPEKK